MHGFICCKTREVLRYVTADFVRLTNYYIIIIIINIIIISTWNRTKLLIAPTHERMARLSRPVWLWLNTEMVYPRTVTHPSTNRARRRATTLIETNALPLSQTATTPLL